MSSIHENIQLGGNGKGMTDTIMQYNLQLEILLGDFCKMIRDKRTSNESLKLHLRKGLRQRKECIDLESKS